jgi:HD-like signal output (HDOD) protein
MSMLANGKHNDPSSAFSRIPQSSDLKAPQQVMVPVPPVMPGALLLFRMLVSNQIADLGAITEVIRNDIGLTVHVLRLAAEEAGYDSSLTDIDEIVVLLGLDRLRRLSDEAAVLSIHPKGDAGLQTCERFAMHARLTALIAEELAGEAASVRQEDAYVAGLLRHVGALPFVFGWSIPELENIDSGEIGSYIARSWHLPDALVDVISGNRDACAPSSLPLFDLVNTADKHAFRLAVGYNF